MNKKLCILGSTGSVGTQVIDVVSLLKDRYTITGLSAYQNHEQLFRQAEDLNVRHVSLAKKPAEDFTTDLNIEYGTESLISLCEKADEVVIALSGISGLPALDYCLRNNKKVFLANKEALVCGGPVIRKLMDASDSQVMPLDSEISAIYQCLQQHSTDEISRILLTCSGGPFRTWSKEDISLATPAQALKHPNWDMGCKISIDSATLANNGLELMETRWFFDVDPAVITVVIHPESIIHSMVEFSDSSILAQLAEPDMRIPIFYAFNSPARKTAPFKKLDIFETAGLTFEKPDLSRFPCLELAYEALKLGHSMQVVYNAADEIAADLFLANRIKFYDINRIIFSSMKHFEGSSVYSLDDIYRLDKEVRDYINKQSDRI